MENPKKPHEINATGLLNVLLTPDEHDVERVVNASSLSVYGKPIVEDVVNNLIDLGVNELVVVVGYKKEQIIKRYEDEYRGTPITYTHQREQIGLAHALLTAESHIDDDFVLMLGENIFKANLGDVLNRQRES